MKTVGIKLADGSFYPVMEEGTAQERTLDLTTANNNQTCVMVDMYRSKTCSMEDAEYIDTLKIENLNAHPNGEPDISFSVGLDENNQLTANIVDTETGAESNSTITLVSRTIEERLQADDYSITHSKKADEATEINHVEVTEEPSESENNAAAGIVAGAGLLAAAGAIAAKRAKETPESDTATEDASLEDTIITEEEPVFDETSIDETAIEESIETPETPIEEPDFSITEDDATTEPESDYTAEEALLSDNLLSDPEFDEMPDSTLDAALSSEPVTEDDFNLGDPAYNQLMSDDFADSDDFKLDEPSADDDFSLDDISDNDEFKLDETIASEELNLDETPAEDDFKLDDISDSSDFNLDETIADDDFNLDEPTAESTDSLDLPDFDEPAAEPTESLDLPDFDEPEEDFLGKDSTEGFADFDDNFTNPGFDDNGFSDDLSDNFADDLSSTDNDSDNMAASGGGISFTGLYDKETELGESGEEEKKTKVPVIICIVCAIICLLATALILFVIPSKFNLIKKSSETTVIEKTADAKENTKEDKKSNKSDKTKKENIVEEIKPVEPAKTETATAKAPESQIPAKEDEIVVIPEAETVIPLPPPVVKSEPEIFKYKIRWGDTLWDISDTFYKNPWRYKDIAKYNNIKNPDHIISGTIILIPED